MLLPTRKTEPTRNLNELTVLLYGDYGVGKSTFCTQLPGYVILATEPGLKSLSTYDVPIGNWDVFLEACAEIHAGNHPYKTIVIDTIDNAYKMCEEWVCRKHKVEYLGDIPYGKGYGLVSTEFHRVINKLARMPYGLWMVSHCKTVDVESRTNTYKKVIPTLADKGMFVAGAIADMILYATITEKMVAGKYAQVRTIYTKPDMYHQAKDKTTLLPEQMPMDVDAFLALFDPFADTSMPAELEAMVSISDVTEGTDGSVSVDVTGGQPSAPTTDTDMADIDALDAILPKPVTGTASTTTRNRKQ